MAFGRPTDVISPATAPIIVAYPSRDDAIVCVASTSTSIHIHTTISIMTDIIQMAIINKDKEDTPVLLFIALSR